MGFGLWVVVMISFFFFPFSLNTFFFLLFLYLFSSSSSPGLSLSFPPLPPKELCLPLLPLVSLFMRAHPQTQGADADIRPIKTDRSAHPRSNEAAVPEACLILA